MADNSGSKKKVMIMSVLAFLLAGGGVFLFFILQGADDLKGDKNKNFSYGNVIRDGVSPFFKFIGGMDDDADLAKSLKDRMNGRGVEIANAASVDVSDWMSPASGGGTAAASASGAEGRSASAVSPASIPRMSGGSRGGLPAGGGGSKSSGGVSSFSGGSGGNGAKVTSGQVGQGGAAPSKGILGALRNSQAMLSSGLRSGSAMTAKSKWDRSFGVGTTGGRGGGNMSYEKGGLVGLDKIKSGEISDLKTSGGISGANAPAASMPKLEDSSKSGSSGDPVADAVKDAAKKAMGDTLNGAINNVGGTAGGGSGGSGGAVTPPPTVTGISEKPAPSGPYCPDGCPSDTAADYKYKDTSVTYKEYDGVWTATYKGEQTNADGKTVKYTDVMVVVPGGNPELTCLKSIENGKEVYNHKEGYKE